jgi:predicted phage terminase large subunit-like protein
MRGGSELQALTSAQLAMLSPYEQEEYLGHLEALHRATGKDSFLKFVGMVDCPGAPTNLPEPDVYYTERLTPAAHHKLVIQAIQDMSDGKDDDVDGLMIFMPPGSAKSSFASTLAPPWLMGRKPGTNVISCSYGQELANRFGRRARTVAKSPEFEQIMGCGVSGDNQAITEWSLTNGSDYRGAGLGAGITGFRADWFFIDDPFKDREAADSETIRQKVWDGFTDDVSTRLKPGGRLVIIQTRWHEDDLSGRLLGNEWKGQSGLWRGTDFRLWKVINLPYLAEHPDDPLGRKASVWWPELNRNLGELLWEKKEDGSGWFLRRDAVRLVKAAEKNPSAARTFSALYQQRPAPAEGSILLRSYWNEWKKTKKVISQDGEVKEIPDPPDCSFVLVMYDTAIEDEEQNDPSAMTCWGIFENISTKKTGEQYNHHHAILLGAWEDRVQAADLADIIQDHYKMLKPNVILIEKRASGAQLVQELKRLRLPVKAWLPKGKPGAKGKVPRAHAAAMVMEQGSVWYIPGERTQKVIDQCAGFPNSTHDDLVDCVTASLQYFRDRFMFQTADEEMDGDEHKAYLQEQMDQNRMGRRLYNGDAPQRRAQNERRIYSESTSTRVQDDATERMTDETRRRLYGD